MAILLKQVEEVEVYDLITSNYKNRQANLEKGIVKTGIKLQLDPEKQSDLLKAILLLDQSLIDTYGERAVLDVHKLAKEQVKVLRNKYCDGFLTDMTGKKGFDAAEILNEQPADREKIQEISLNFAYDSTPVSRIRTAKDTRPIDQRLLELDSEALQIALIQKEFKIDTGKACQMLEILI